MNRLFLISLITLFVFAPEISAEENTPLSELKSVGSEFNFAVISSPSLGNKDSGNSYNSRKMLRKCLKELNGRQEPPVFTVFLGDLFSRPHSANYKAYLNLLSKTDTVPFFLLGECDPRPPYQNFLEFQKRLTGMDSLYYSFDVGKWHFIVLPGFLGYYNAEMIMSNDMLNWLKEDISYNDTKPTVVFTHFNLLPGGCVFYDCFNYPSELKNKLLNIISSQGNIKYCFSGHLHAGLKTSKISSWEYEGIKFINTPTLTPPKKFDDEFEEFQKGLEKGGYYLLVNVNENNLNLIGKLIGNGKEFIYPNNFNNYVDNKIKGYATYVGHMTSSESLVNGNFDSDLKAWNKSFRHGNNSNNNTFAEIVANFEKHNNVLNIVSRSKGPDLCNEEIMEISQVVSVAKDKTPVFKAEYFLKEKPFEGGGYINISVFEDNEFKLMAFLNWGDQKEKTRLLPRIFSEKLLGKPGGVNTFKKLAGQRKAIFYNLPSETGKWHKIEINLKTLFNWAKRKSGEFEKQNINKILINIGTWSNCCKGGKSSAYFDNIEFFQIDKRVRSTIDGKRPSMQKNPFQTEFGI